MCPLFLFSRSSIPSAHSEGSIASVSSERLSIQSADMNTGLVELHILPVDTNDYDTLNANYSLSTGSFTANMTSVSRASAAAILKRAGIPVVSLNVFGAVVTYVVATNNVSNISLSRLADDSFVIASSVTSNLGTIANIAVCTFSRKTHI